MFAVMTIFSNKQIAYTFKSKLKLDRVTWGKGVQILRHRFFLSQFEILVNKKNSTLYLHLCFTLWCIKSLARST